MSGSTGTDESSVPFSSLSVLVVEDEIVSAWTIEGILQTLKVDKLRLAADGETALRLLEEEPADLVFCDAVMPVMDGLELCVRMRFHPDRRIAETLLIMITAQDETKWQQAAREAGVNDFMKKPVSFGQLVEVMTRTMARPRAFLRTSRYVGPDRRDPEAGPYRGPERRRRRG